MPYPVSASADTAPRIAAAFAEQIGAARYHLWFPPNAKFAWRDDRLCILCRSDYVKEWAGEQFGDALKLAVRNVLGHDAAIDFVVDAAIFEETEAATAKSPAVNLLGERDVPAVPKPQPVMRRWKTFGEFVLGAGNRVAAAAAQSVLDDGGLGPNPLVIFGPVGTGKTHLLEAVTAGLKAKRLAPLFLTAEEFTHRFIQATRTSRTAGFRRLTRSPGALILDDLQFLANKRATQEEFLHLLDVFAADGKPVVLGLDTHPRLADELLPEMTDRLLGGAAWGLLPPDDETRYAILKAKAIPPLPDDVLRHLARHLTGNVRELEGALHTLRHYAKVTGEPITRPLAEEILRDLMRHNVRAITLAMIDTATCKVLKLPGGSLQSKARTATVTQPRMLAVYLARKHTAATYGEIAKHFGVRQHSTAIAAEKKVRTWLKSNTSLFQDPAADLLARIEREMLR